MATRQSAGAVRYTSHQVARGSRPDAVTPGTWHLVKNVGPLRLTYQIRLLTFGALRSKVRLEIHVPRTCRPSEDLRRFLKENERVVRIQRPD